jgi:hypothetical protein
MSYLKKVSNNTANTFVVMVKLPSIGLGITIPESKLKPKTAYVRNAEPI